MSETPETPEAAPAYPVLAAPADGIPDVIVDERGLQRAADAVAAADGPVAIDAERAAGYRYGNRAYLVQLRREGAGTFLLDPIALPDLSPMQEAIGDAEWVLHAATQDLPCLAEVGMQPRALFDTELGSRLAGLPRVGLAAVIEHYVGISLAKEHSAVDWSTRPLPEPWLTYAALDVEVLVEVRNRLRADLEQQGKLEWALQDFAALTSFTGSAQRTEPWRRTSGMHRIKDKRAVARVRELWLTRDAIAQERDTAPGRILPDAMIVELANSGPRTTEALQQVGSNLQGASRSRARLAGRGTSRYAGRWLDAIERVAAMKDADLPPATVRNDAPPPQRTWADRNPEAAARLSFVRAALTDFAEQHHVPIENLITPDTLRRVLWTPPKPLTDNAIRARLAELGARPWQIDLVAPYILEAPDEPPATGE
ncbi:MAG TPA: HRDC domain-containing protein [Flexivirga sp.]|uniref:HRDC domain-containing protein n=1 Tax=Flexivirga sp. TaxID=1962927 RepID=UPI002C6FF0C2|nr:HRDC domain-containing protein [Flexivirga sp.]HWC20819.1 HRDC domain-containing protein [Flexivirga sp.]